MPTWLARALARFCKWRCECAWKRVEKNEALVTYWSGRQLCYSLAEFLIGEFPENISKQPHADCSDPPFALPHRMAGVP